jgi:ketosteroid isomerase-like protein
VNDKEATLRALVDKYYEYIPEAFTHDNWEPIFSIVTDDVVFAVPPTHPMAGDYRSKEGLRRMLLKSRDAGIALIRVDLQYVALGGDVAIAVFDLHLRGEPEPLSEVEVFSFRDDKISQVKVYCFDLAPLLRAHEAVKAVPHARSPA